MTSRATAFKRGGSRRIATTGCEVRMKYENELLALLLGVYMGVMLGLSLPYRPW
jgi:hypothetical protein